MNLLKTLEKIKNDLNELKVDFALIGGFGLAAHGVHRATNDVDFIIHEDDRALVEKGLKDRGWTLLSSTSEVLHFSGFGHVDFLVARRPLSQQMIRDAKIVDSIGVKAVSAEGIIGLKIQAYKNNPKRTLRDKADIQSLFQKNTTLNLSKIKEYADVFNEWDEINRIKDDA